MQSPDTRTGGITRVLDQKAEQEGSPLDQGTETSHRAP